MGGSGFTGGFSATPVQTTQITPPFPTTPGSAGSAFIDTGNPFTTLGGGPPLDINAVATVQGCCGYAGAFKQVVFDFSVAGTGSHTMNLSLTQSIALIAEGTISPPAFAAAAVGSHFEIDGPNGPLWTMNSLDFLSNPACGLICSMTSTQPITSGVLNLASGSYQVVIDPLAQAEVVFEPS